MTPKIDNSAKAYESTLVIPTYELKEENKNPCFDNQYGISYIYPYTLLDDYSTQPMDRTYKTLVLENRYLKVTVMIELGGRVYSVYDKISQKEVFYKNKVIKFAPLALRGAFFSGGIEYNFPIGHALTGTETINWEIRNNSDGSSSVMFGAIEHLHRMRWMVTLTLEPDSCLLIQDLKIQNPYVLPGRYFYWCTPACEANEKTEFIYPFRYCRSYMWDGESTWPKCRIDLSPIGEKLISYIGVPTWPSTKTHDPVNLRWEKNIISQVSIFGSDVEEDFFGAWQHSDNHGYAHFANHHDIAGMKHWSWGRSGMSLLTQETLTDDGSRYAETQCGLMSNQHDFDFLMPSQTRSWRELWLPLRGLEGLTCASAEMGAKLKLSKMDKTDKLALTIALCSVRHYEKIIVEIFLQEKSILRKEISISPENPWSSSQTMDASKLATHPLNLKVTTVEGKVLLQHTLNRESKYSIESEIESKPPQTADDFFNLAFSQEKLERKDEALFNYHQALKIDPLHGPSNLQLGLMHLTAADFNTAFQCLNNAQKAGRKEANYYLGNLLLLNGKPKEAEGHLKSIPDDSPFYSATQCGLSCLALYEHHWKEAINYSEKALSVDHNSTIASLLNAVALRNSGSKDKAKILLSSILGQDPLNHVAIQESIWLEEDRTIKEQLNDKLNQLLANDRQYVIDLACFYIQCGLFSEALSILTEKNEGWNYPINHYLIGFLHTNLGKMREAKQWFDKANKGNPDLVFPSRLEEIISLLMALKENPYDSKAKYYLGNYYYAHQRYEEAITLWEQALIDLNNFDVILRNLGLAYWQRRNDIKKAISSFEKALNLNHLNYDLYLHLDKLYKESRLSEKREKLYEKIKLLAEPRHDVQKLAVLILVDLGRYDEAITKLDSENFLPLEMDQSFRKAYIKAHLGHAEKLISSGKILESIADFNKALEYPRNVGVGELVLPQNAEILYKLGCAYELLGKYHEATSAWESAANEYHLEGQELYPYIQRSLEKLNIYNKLGL